MWYVLFGFDDWKTDFDLVGAVALAWSGNESFVKEYRRMIEEICDYYLEIYEYDALDEEELVQKIKMDIEEPNAGYMPSTKDIYGSRLLYLPLKKTNDYVLAVQTEWGIAWGDMVEEAERMLDLTVIPSLAKITILCKFVLLPDVYECVRELLLGLHSLLARTRDTQITILNIDKVYDIVAIYQLALMGGPYQKYGKNCPMRDVYYHKYYCKEEIPNGRNGC